MNLVDEENLGKTMSWTLHVTLDANIASYAFEYRLSPVTFQLFVGVVDFLEIVDRHDDDGKSPDETPGGITI